MWHREKNCSANKNKLQRLFRMTCLCIAVFLAVHQMGAAQEIDIYVFSKPLHAKTMERDKNLYVSLDDLATALNLKETKQDGSVILGTPPAKPAASGVFLNGKPFNQTATGSNGMLYVPLKAFVEASGNKYLFNKETGIIDVIPGSSSLTSSLVNDLEQTTAFNESPASPSSSPAPGTPSSRSSAAAPPGPSGPNLSAELEQLKDTYSKSLESKANLIQYFANLQGWANAFQGTTQQYYNQLHAIETGKDQNQALLDLSNLFLWYDAQMGSAQQSFYQIVPPPEFQASHSVLRGMVDRMTQLEAIGEELSHVTRGIRSANPDQAQALLRRLHDLMQQLGRLKSQMLQDEATYLRMFKTDLGNLK